MNDIVIKKINGLLGNIVKQTKDDMEGQLAKADVVRREMHSMVPEDTEDRLQLEANISEARGDICLRCKKPSQAEREYSAMLEYARKLYMGDKSAHSFIFARTARKYAAFYELLLGINQTVPLPRELRENDMKILANTELLHKEAIGSTYTSDDKVDVKIVKLQADSYYKLGCICSLRNQLDEAEGYFKSSLGLENAIFKTVQTKDRSVLVSRSESALNVIYMLGSKNNEAIEHNKAVIARLEQVEKADPAFYGRHIAMAHLHIGKCCSSLEGEMLKGMNEYLTALEKITAVNNIAENKLTEDVIMFSIAVGDFFRRMGMVTNAEIYYINAVANVKKLPEGKCSVACKNALDRITGKGKKEDKI